MHFGGVGWTLAKRHAQTYQPGYNKDRRRAGPAGPGFLGWLGVLRTTIHGRYVLVKAKQIILPLTLLLIVAGLACCGGTPAPETYTDPFAYCAAVGTMDAPDAAYTGPKVPESVAEGLRRAFNTPDTPLEVYENGTFWRCMDGEVYGCFVGANLPCEARANTDKTPTQAEIDFCQQNPDSDFIPAVATGRETVYEWRCRDGAPEIVQQVFHPDAQGFLSEFWYKIESE